MYMLYSIVMLTSAINVYMRLCSICRILHVIVKRQSIALLKYLMSGDAVLFHRDVKFYKGKYKDIRYMYLAFL